jgi:hypothetical protein
VALVDPIDLTSFALTPEAPYFLQTYSPELDPLDQADADLSELLAEQTVVDVASIGAALDGALAGVDSFLGDSTGDTTAADVSNLIGSAGAIDGAIASATTANSTAHSTGAGIGVTFPPLTGINVTPPAAAPPPAPVLPSPGAPGSVGPPAVGVTLQFTNVTRPGSPGRVKVGEQFTVQIFGPPGVAIYAVAKHNGQDNGQAGFGVIPASGTLLISGSFGVADSGTWIENWYAQGNYIGEIAFTVE